MRFHSGVNLSVAPGGSDRSAAPLDVQEATNAQRVAEAADIGFDFIRLRVSLAPWTDTGSTADQQRGLTLANGITQQALAYGKRVDVVMMAGSLSTTTAAGLICLPIPPRSPPGHRDGKRYSLSFQIPSMLPSSP